MVAGLKREHWRTAAPIREIFRNAFKAVRMPYLNPHSFRDALARLGETRCQTPEDFKAWSQNLGHEKVLTTFFSYGAVPASRQREIIRGLVRSLDTVSSEDKIAAAVVRRMREEETRA